MKPAILQTEPPPAAQLHRAVFGDSLKTSQAALLRRCARYCAPTVIAFLATFAATPLLLAQGAPGEHLFTENLIPPHDGEYQGAAPVPFVPPSGVTVTIAMRSYGKVSVGSVSEDTLRVGGVFTQTGIMDGAIQLDPAQPPVRFSMPVSLVILSQPSPTPQPVPTEILQMNLQGGSLPAGVMLRESPTRASRGVTTFQAAQGGYLISSFFDVFTELSLDGGQSWTPAQQALRLELLPRVPEHFFATDCFPLPGEYQTAAGETVAYPNGVVIRNFRHRPDTLRLPAPGSGEQQLRPLGGTVELDLSRDGGNSFTHYYVITLSDCLVSGYSISSGGDRPMESLSLNFSVIQPGLKPVMIRESPTLPSLGRTGFRAIADGYMISSFFDIFTEVSLDDGQTWTPAGGALHAMLLPYIEQENIYRSEFVLPRDGSLETRPHAEPVRFANGIQCRNIRFQDFSRSQQPPGPNLARLMEEEGIFYFEISANGGQTWTPHRAPATGSVQVLDNGFFPSSRRFDTEMLALNISGGSLPAGVMVRESPTRASQGRMAIATHPRIGQEVVVDFLIESFFDVFTEISLDGGQNWLPAQNAAHLDLRAKPPEVFQPSDWLPLAVQYRESDFDFAAHYGGGGGGGGAAIRGIVVQGLEGIIAQGRAPLPVAGTTLTRNVTVPMELRLSLDGGVNFAPGGGQALFVVKFSDLLVDSIQWTMTTEVLQLDLTGGSLPPGVMLRESPTRASLGRTSLRAVPGGYRTSSFFDIFTELSLDGGQTWTPSCDTLHLAAQETAPERAFANKLIPPNGSLLNPEGARSLHCATGEHIKTAKLFRAATGGVSPPAPGQVVRVADEASAEFLYSTDGGQTFTPIRAQAYFRYELRDALVSSFATFYDTEMLQLEMWGGNLPAGVMLRESPSKASVGRTSIRVAADGSPRISSFFDVFTELSLDGGRTWTPFDLPMHYEFTDILISSFAATDLWPPLGHFRLPPGDPDFDLLYASGARMSFFDVFYGDLAVSTPLPDPGLSATFNWQAQIRYTLFLPDGTPTRSTMNASLSARITGNTAIGGTRSFDTEMLQLDLVGGTLPPGVMLRESPTKQSDGKTTLRSVPGGSMVDSFFDIFTEISLDGGQSWTPSDGPMRLEFASPEIGVEHPAGANLADGTSSVAFSPVLAGGNTSRTFTIKNTGTADLIGLGITFDGPDAAAFSVTVPPTSPVPGPGGTTTFTVRLSSATAGAKSAAMHIASNDSDEHPFDIALTGRVLTPAADDDGDGITNEAELNLADCDFDPVVNDSAHILTLRANGLYRASDMQALALGNPVLARDPANGHFHLGIGVLKSPNLADWTPLLDFTSIYDPLTGRLDLDIPPDGSSAQFYQVLGSAP